MAEIIAHKKIVISGEDRVTSVIAKTNQAFNQLEQHLSQLGMKFNFGATEQTSYKNALNSTKSTVNETDEAIQKLDHNIDKLSGTRTVTVQADTITARTSLDEFGKNVDALKNKAPIIKPHADTSEAQTHLHQLTGATNEAQKAGHSLTRNFVVGSLISNGIQTATTSLIGFAKQGLAAAAAGQQVVARWSALGMTKGQIKEVGAAVADLKENTNMSGAAVGNLVTRFYGLTGSAKEAITLSKGVGSITDSLHLSNAASDAFANGLARIESAGKVTTQSLGRLEKQAPGLTAALQKASGMSKKSFDDLLASGKMTTSQFNDILEKASVDYAKNAKSWEKTSEGAIHHMKTEWSDSWKTMMAPLAQSSSQGLGALSKALDKLQPQFKEVGEAIADLATKFAKWLTPKHAEDLGKIVTAFGRMAIVLGKGVWKAAMAPFELIGRVIQLLSGKHGDALDAIADGLDRISKNKIAMSVLEGIGMVLMTQFAYGKLFKIADGLGLVSKGILSIGRMKFTGHIFRDIFNGAESLKRIKINPAQWFKGGTSWAKNLFKPLPSEALKTGESAGGNFITRFAAKTNASKFAQVGRSLGGRILSGVGLAVEAYDLVKDIHGAFTTHNGTTRSRDVGKAAGAGIGAGIGFFFGGPAGAALGGLIGRTIGGKIGPSVGKFGKSIGSVLNDIFVKHDWNKVWSTIGKGWQSFWKGMGNWWDETIGKKGSSHSSKEPSQKEIKSLGGNHYSKSDIANIKQMNSAVRAYTQSLKELKAIVKKDDPTKQLRDMSKEFRKINPAVKESAKYWKGLAKPLETSAKAFKVVDKALDTFKRKNNPMDRLNSSVQKLTKTVKKEQFGKLLAQQMQVADKSMSGKHSFVGQFEKMTKNVISELKRFRKSFDSDWKNTWTRLDSYPSRGLSRALSVVSSHLNAIYSREHSFTSRFISSWRSWISNVVSAMRSGFDKLPGIAQRAMSGIVSRLNSGISAINAVISDFGGDKRLGSIHYARGTFFHPGGKAVLNDGPTAHKQELVWEPSRGFSLPQGQNTVHDLERGAMVLDAPHTDPLLNRMGIPHYAGGTLSEDEQDKLAEEFIDNPVKASRDLVLKVTNWNSNVPVIADLGKATAIGFSRGIANVLKDLLGIIKEPINGDWTPVIKSAARLLHFHIAGWQIAKLLRQIQTESGGREVITNNWDSNAAAGHPSQGLLQFIPSTFNTWAVGKYRDINKGFDQILAAINALNHGGEGGWGNIGNGHGWATGGEITSQQFGWVGDNAQHHEFVINPYNSNALPLLTKAWTVMNANHPEWRTPTDNSYNSEMIALMKAAVASINSIDIHPRVEVEDVAKPINKYNAKRIGMMK
ncbi:tape measure protein [Limosilactobacillus vaginalis]|uniref:Tape measure domain protein n=1 Tax=Limosilactobacillus vaginalis DSM 5837 = ATCC 49540 TaxID=1423814 RepID=C2EWF7_9LACO|nr:tape measure protein [Limosilactobacillus vaginalis]EEJ39793.1 tape measure domain protein [Limosilactobacillus vaginalis DSM 5837 = ATCC 49540]KRM49085.1 phage tape measure protein [Limosilactobacillus vaginalis DSM 5837 = ATCC 49540]QFS34326.1 tape measure protein [Limosilactobacillus vaginalis]